MRYALFIRIGHRCYNMLSARSLVNAIGTPLGRVYLYVSQYPHSYTYLYNVCVKIKKKKNVRVSMRDIIIYYYNYILYRRRKESAETHASRRSGV